MLQNLNLMRKMNIVSKLISHFYGYYKLRVNFIVREEAENDMRDWMDMYLCEIDKIESFFKTKF